MSPIIHILVSHGAVTLFVAVLAEQGGLPIPSAPMLLAAGSFIRLGRMNLPISIGVAMAACLVADSSWYEVGRRRRLRVLGKRAARTVAPKHRGRLIKTALDRSELGTLLLAKFLPGPNLISPLVGLLGRSRGHFLIFDGIASIIWASGYIAVGYIFSNKLQEIAANGSRLGLVLLVIVVCLFAAFAAIRFTRRRWPQWRPRAPQVST
jgi:membrane protein DedA with SNARE-associated domain